LCADSHNDKVMERLSLTAKILHHGAARMPVITGVPSVDYLGKLLMQPCRSS
jgi:hypothetical protein